MIVFIVASQFAAQMINFCKAVGNNFWSFCYYVALNNGLREAKMGQFHMGINSGP